MKEPKYDFGLNVLKNLLEEGLEKRNCDRLDIMAYNINLDFLLRIYQKYDCLEQINIYSNSEHITYKNTDMEKIKNLLKEDFISFHHIPERENIIHAKVYRFLKNGDIILSGVGSPNFTNTSNQNFEFIYYIYDDILKDIFGDFKELSEVYDYEIKEEIPKTLEETESIKIDISDRLLENLWKHQEEILKWLVSRNSAIINIPPGTGKTKIALQFGKYLMNKNPISFIVLVPQTPLIDQWLNRFENEGITGYEWGTDITGKMETFIAQPEDKAVVTLYSRFYDQYEEFIEFMEYSSPSLYLISDECQKWFNKLNILSNLNSKLNSYSSDVYHIGLSATLQTFNDMIKDKYIELMGGEDNRYRISLQSYYSDWNELNENPTLKPIKYHPIKYKLSKEEMDEYNKKTKQVAIEMERESIGDDGFTAAMKRARWVRSLEGGINKLYEFISSHMEIFNKNNSLIFVQTNDFAERIRDQITSNPGWDKRSSAYVYDSSRRDSYRNYAMKKYKNNQGFCLISERMLREGFDLPKISIVVLQGSHKSPRDWIQKIGRAIRYDPEEPESYAQIIDVVFCDNYGEPLSIEKERYEVLNSISI